jgi:tRNA-Thr(GGU) m(6)t(6)A37 methyltransferase TsaA
MNSRQPDPEVFTFSAIGMVRSPYPEKFAVPRQPGLVTAAQAQLVLTGDCNREEILRGIEGFSHLWLTFVFHQVMDQGWKPTVRPPRLGGNQRLGVFATRSPFRPNPIGLSVVSLLGIENRRGQWLLHLGGIDLVDGTPILDIKPYVPYVDAIANARGGFTEDFEQQSLQVRFNTQSQAQLAALGIHYPHLQQLIEQVIGQQPQPAYQKDPERIYGMHLYDLNIRWTAAPGVLQVVDITPLDNQPARREK